jgi:drug/metabolite transporter (DMT)-like permease
MSLFAIILVLISTFIHAGWNMLIRSQQNSYTFLRITIVITLVGIGPALLAEFGETPFPPQVWFYLILAGIFQAIYYLGLSQGYQNGDFTVVYPVARALPILLIAVADVARGRAPSSIAWLGMVAVSIGCLITPMESIRNFKLSYYWNRAMIWIVVTALGIAGYSIVDKVAAELIEPGPWTAARYGIYETLFSGLAYWLVLKVLGQPTGAATGWQGWKWPVVGAVGVFGAYWLILWSYQLSVQASYVVALRQLSIVIGVALGGMLFREPAPALRFSAAVMIALGVAGIVLIG